MFLKYNLRVPHVAQCDWMEKMLSFWTSPLLFPIWVMCRPGPHQNETFAVVGRGVRTDSRAARNGMNSVCSQARGQLAS